MDNKLRKLPLGIQDFEDLRQNGYLYVDKTAYIYRLVTMGKPYFLGRPRRFGKSLLLSTLRDYFLGKKELFEGLAIAELEKDWTVYPVIYIDFNNESYTSISKLEAVLDDVLSIYEDVWGRKEKETTFALRFKHIISRAREVSQQKVVVLIDEYDKPLVNTLEDEKLNDAMRDLLKGFYGVLKSNDANIRFVMLTGVTKFAKLGIFSDLNFLTDISLNKEYAAICGIAEEELVQNFEPEIQALGKENGMTFEAALAGMKKRYDGYRFARQSPDIYNPYSVLNTLLNRYFGYYWFETGTPTFLVNLIKRGDMDVREFSNDEVDISAQQIMDYRADMSNPIPIFYQSGYLTIKSYDTDYDEFKLGYPNEEVKYGFLNELITYLPASRPTTEFDVRKLCRDLVAGDIETMLLRLQTSFAAIPFDLENRTEKHYQTIFYLIFTMMGQFIKVEEHSSKGSSDAVVETKDAVYIFEFKLSENATAAQALLQIKAKNYAMRYQMSGKRIVKIGVQFDNNLRTLGEWIIED